ncbi:hypothetical protein M8C21_033007, partial [Ambrosia artemisiifolia]
TVKKVSKPYIDQIATATLPHLDKARERVAPYTKEAVIAYGKFLESVQGVIQESLKKHEISSALATKELASALLVLPILILFKTFEKAKRPTCNSNQPRCKAKRAHPDNEDQKGRKNSEYNR